MTKITNIAKNTSYFTLALILQKVISFTYFIILARYLGPTDLGKYYFAVSFVGLLSIFIDIGLANVLVREIARYSSNFNENKERVKSMVGGVIFMKITLAVVVSLACAWLVNIMNYPETTRHLVYIMIISMNLDSFTASLYAIVRGFHNLLFESIGAVIFQIIVFSFGFFALYNNFSLKIIISALALASIFNFLYSYLIATKTLKFPILPRWNHIMVRQLIILTLPFAIFAIFQRTYMYLDTVLLSKLAGDYYVGIYQVPFKIVFALQFLPMAFVASLYPAMSTYWVDNKKQLAISFERAMNYLLIISVPIALGIIALTDKIILLLKAGYEDSVLPMQVIMLALIFIFINFPIGSLLNATNRQNINTANMGVVLVLSIVANLILIPNYQAVGASITVLITNMLMFILGIYWVPKIITFRARKVLLVFLKVAISATLMSILVIYLKEYLNIFVTVFCGGITYFIVLFLLKGFRKEDMVSIYNSLFKKFS